MALSLLCDEHIPYSVISGLRRNGIDAVSVQEVDERSTDDPDLLVIGHRLGRVIYTWDDDFLRLNSSGIPHLGVLYHNALKYSIGQAIDAVATACQVLSAEEIANRVEFL